MRHLTSLFFFLVAASGTAAGQSFDRDGATPDMAASREAASGGDPASPAGPKPAASPSPEPAAVSPAALGPRSLGYSFAGEDLGRLPLGQGVWSVFETVEPTAILDRIGGAGLYLGEAGLTGIRGSSWTQTSWALGDLDITDPDRTGTPLFFIDPEALESMDIEAGIAPATLRGVGAGVDLAVRRPGASWHKTIEVHQAPSFLEQAFQRDGAPAIAHQESLASGLVQLEGPVIRDRLGVFISATMGRGVRAERADPTTLEGREAGVLTHTVFTPTPRDEVRTLAGYQQLVHPYAGRARFGGADVPQRDHLFLLESTWLRQGKRPWAASAGYVRGSFTPEVNPDGGWTIERTDDGPVQQMFPGAGTRARASLSGWMDPLTSAHHALRVGASLSGTRSDTGPAEPRGLTPETVGAIGARVWDYGWPGPTAKWRGTEIAAYASDQFHVGPLSLDAGLRYESSRASAADSDGHIDWSAVTPRLLLRVRPLPHERPHLVLLGGYAQYLSRLPLNLMAYGDPAAPQGVVYRWVDRNNDGIFQPRERGPLVSRVGPGGSFSSIDPGLKPPRSKEVFLGFETQIGAVHVRGLAYHRIERDILTSINVGVPVSDYDVTYVQDPGDDINGGTTIQMLPIYNRRPESFGLDRYLLTNDSTKGKNKGLEMSMDGRIGRRLHLMAGATASTSSSPAAYRGFLAIENDQGLVGERLELPNAATLSKGRLFFERGYTIKIAGSYQAPHDFNLGLIARYQDGQHFARFIIPLDLNQGPEPIRAITNGDSRFTYVLTVDARLEKGFTFGRTRLAASIEAYNLRGTGIEVEENVEWGPLYRTTSAVQPPRSVRVGLRLDF